MVQQVFFNLDRNIPRSERSPVEYKTEGEKRIVNVGKKIQGVIKPIEGLRKGSL